MASIVALLFATFTACGGNGGGAPTRQNTTGAPNSTPDPYADAPLRGCADRVEAEGAEAGPVEGPETMEFGTTFASFGFLRGGRPSLFFRQPERRYGTHELVFVLRAGVQATLVVPRANRTRVGLRYVSATPVDGPFTVANGGAAVRFAACPADEAARTYDGTVGTWTEFNGDLLMARPGCHVLELHVAGQPRPYRRRLSIPPGRCPAATGQRH